MNKYYADIYDRENNFIKRLDVEITKNGDMFLATLKKEDIPKDTYNVNFMPEFENASAEEKGYMVAPRGGPYVKNSYMMCCFREQADYEHVVEDSAIALFGVKKEEYAFAGIVTGMRLDYDTIVGVKNNIHYIYPRFKLDGEGAYEDISVEYHFIKKEDADYSDIAKVYRKYQLDRGACVPLKERIVDNPQLKYAAEAMNVRIRLGMKPLPTPVMEQTLENEPEMVISCSFDRMKDLIDEFKRQGIKRAEFCLIGWNLKGHDGRYPEMFPVEESLGGEEKLRELIKYAQNNGYQITCHSNSSDAYTISSMWNEDDIIELKNGEISVDPNPWSGGRMYQLCPSVAEKQSAELLPKIADLGFKGIHYIDVITLAAPRKCYSKKHFLNKKQSVAINDRIMKLAKKLFGGFSSEGAYDVNIGNLDYALLVHSRTIGADIPICDRVIPLWELVYHGIVLHNTSWETASYNANGEDSETQKRRLKNIEFGGRPQCYIHHQFHGHREQIKLGYTTETDELMAKSVSRMKELYDDYEKLSYLQYEFMEKHKEITENVFETTYSDGTKIIVDYNNETYRLEKGIR